MRADLDLYAVESKSTNNRIRVNNQNLINIVHPVNLKSLKGIPKFYNAELKLTWSVDPAKVASLNLCNKRVTC